MSTVFEAEQAGKRQSWANIIANIQSTATPYTSMVQKRERPAQILHTWQMQSYPDVPFAGVLDGKDATDFDSVPRSEVQCRTQKSWRKPGVSDFADEAEIVGLSGNESASQIAIALVLVKRIIEQAACSNMNTAIESAPGQANETRGNFSWFANSAQSYLPVPAGYRTPAASRYSGTLANFNELVFLALARSSFIQRKGPFKMDAFLGINLKAEFTNFTKYVDNVTNKTAVRTFTKAQNDTTYMLTTDKLVLDTGEVMLHSSSFLYKDKATGNDTAYTHNSGFICDMEMAGLAYTRLPRVVKLPYLGGSNKAIVDTIFLNMQDNPLGAIVIECNG